MKRTASKICAAFCILHFAAADRLRPPTGGDRETLIEVGYQPCHYCDP